MIFLAQLIGIITFIKYLAWSNSWSFHGLEGNNIVKRGGAE